MSFGALEKVDAVAGVQPSGQRRTESQSARRIDEDFGGQGMRSGGGHALTWGAIHTMGEIGGPEILLRVSQHPGSNLKKNMEVAQNLLTLTKRELAQKGISYDDLRPALVPNPSAKDVAFVFDTAGLADDAEDDRIFNAALLPLLDKESSHGILQGYFTDLREQECEDLDDLDEGEEQHELVADKEQSDLLMASLVQSPSDHPYRHPVQFFLIYVSNISGGELGRLHRYLFDFAPYAGYVDLTFASELKTLVAEMLPAREGYVKHGKHVIMGQEKRLGSRATENPLRYPFEAHGYIPHSISLDHFEMLLGYKIECLLSAKINKTMTVLLGLEAVGAVMTGEPPKKGLDVVIDEETVRRLRRTPSATMPHTLANKSLSEILAGILLEKIQCGYIYSITPVACEDCVTVKFDVVLEFEQQGPVSRYRVLVTLQYDVKAHAMRVTHVI